MSYDIYCYKSKKDKPNLEEAELFINLENIPINTDNKEKELIAESLINFNPKLERFKMDYAEIAKLQNITIDNAKNEYSNIELNSIDENLPFQFEIENDSVTISIPYWFSDHVKVNDLFQEIKKHLDVIHNAVGYHTYDPQTEEVSLSNNFNVIKACNKYLEGVSFVHNYTQETNNPGFKKNNIFRKIIIALIIIIVINLLLKFFNII